MDVSIGRIYQVIKTNLIFIIAFSLIVGGTFFVGTKLFISNKYESTVKFYVSTNAQGTSSAEEINALALAQRVVNTYIQLLSTTNFFESVAEELGEDYTWQEVALSTTFSILNDTEVFQASIITTDPDESYKIAKALEKVAPITLESYNESLDLKVVDSPMLPKNPVSPNATLNTLIGFILGAIIATGFKLVKSFTDVRIRYDDDTSEKLGVPVLGTIPDFNKVM